MTLYIKAVGGWVPSLPLHWMGRGWHPTWISWSVCQADYDDVQALGQAPELLREHHYALPEGGLVGAH